MSTFFLTADNESSDFTQFKKTIFECPAGGVIYDNTTGRIKQITFKQK